MKSLLYFIFFLILHPTNRANLVDIMHHKIFNGCIFDISSNFEKNYFNAQNSKSIITFVLYNIVETRTRFHRSQETPEINLVAFSPKHKKPCLIFIVDGDAARFKLLWHFVLQGLSYANLDPQFIIIQTRLPASEFLASFRQRQFWVSSAILLWQEPTRKLFRLCVSCRDPIPQEDLSKFSRRSLKIVPKIEKYLSWFFHLYGPRPPPRAEMLSCSARYWQLNTHFHTCVPYVLSSHFNYSLDPRTYIPLGRVNPGELAGRDLYEAKFFKRRLVRTRLFNYATEYSEYVLVFYTGRGGSLNFMKLFEPLDTWIWTGLVLTFLVTLVFVYGLTTTRGSIGDALFTVFSVVLDQSQHDPGTEAGKLIPNMVTIMITSWTLTLSIISCCYKGDLLSYFVLETLPSVPDTIVDLVKSDILITTNIQYRGYDTKFRSSLKLMLSHLSQGDDSHAKFYARFSQKTTLITGKPELVVMNISQNKAVATDRGMIKLPQTFATVNPKVDSDKMKVLVAQQTKYFIQEKKRVGENPLVTRSVWFVDNNEYAGMIKIGVARLCESGIYAHWMRNYHMHHTLMLLRWGDTEIKKRRPTLNYYGILVMTGADMINNNLFDSAFEPVALDNLKLCFILYFAGFLIGLVCWVNEFKEILVRRRRNAVFEFKNLP